MEFRILNSDFEAIDVLDKVESIIWTNRFGDAGDFELYTPVNEKMLSNIRVGYYLFCDTFYDLKTDTANLMIMETIEITSNSEEGNKLRVTGRDLKSILERRIVWGQKTFANTDKLSYMINTLINECIINPQNWTKTYQDSHSGSITISVSGENRKISNFEIAKTSFTDVDLNATFQYNGESLYSIFSEITEKYNVGYKILYDFTNKKLLLYLLDRVYKTYEQNQNGPILFSPEFENLKNSNYIESIAIEKNVALIIGEGDEYNVMYNIIDDGSKGLDRKELGITASDVSRTMDDDSGEPREYGNADYLGFLKERGQKELETNSYQKTYEGEAETIKGYKYPNDFDIGDIVEIINEWGISSEVLISEVCLSVSTSGISIIPTFSSLTEGGV